MPPKKEHILVHVVGCPDSSCSEINCDELKRVYVHSRTCQRRVSGGCIQCETYLRILSDHAHSCDDTECIVPNCVDMQISEKRRSFVRRLFWKRNDAAALRRRMEGSETKERDLEDALYDARPHSTRAMGCLITASDNEPQFVTDNPLFAHD